jgi:hypothetical protein
LNQGEDAVECAAEWEEHAEEEAASWWWPGGQRERRSMDWLSSSVPPPWPLACLVGAAGAVWYGCGCMAL